MRPGNRPSRAATWLVLTLGRDIIDKVAREYWSAGYAAKERNAAMIPPGSVDPLRIVTQR